MQVYKTGPDTERLEHRAFTVEDTEAFFELNSHPEVMRYTGEPPLQSVDEARTAIKNYPDFDTVGYGRWASIFKETRSVIGFCGLKYLPELDLVDVGYRYLPQYWGQGLATEACTASIRFGFDTLRLKQIIGLVLPANIASQRVMEKSGLRPDGSMLYEDQTVLRYAISR